MSPGSPGAASDRPSGDGQQCHEPRQRIRDRVRVLEMRRMTTAGQDPRLTLGRGAGDPGAGCRGVDPALRAVNGQQRDGDRRDRVAQVLGRQRIPEGGHGHRILGTDQTLGLGGRQGGAPLGIGEHALCDGPRGARPVAAKARGTARGLVRVLSPHGKVPARRRQGAWRHVQRDHARDSGPPLRQIAPADQGAQRPAHKRRVVQALGLDQIAQQGHTAGHVRRMPGRAAMAGQVGGQAGGAQPPGDRCPDCPRHRPAMQEDHGRTRAPAMQADAHRVPLSLPTMPVGKK